MKPSTSLPDKRPTTIIRRAQAEDTSAILEIYLESRRKFLPYAPLAHSPEEIRLLISDILVPKPLTRVAASADRTVGLLGMSTAEDCSWIDQLYLHPDFVNLGLGSQLVNYAKESLAEPIRLYCFQANTAALRFYRRHGFIAIRYTDGAENEEQCPDMLLEWKAEPK